MAIDPEKLYALDFPEIRHAYGRRDSMLYALGIGIGLDPTNEDQLRFVTEPRLAAMPTMAAVLAYPGFWARDLDTGIDWVKLVHGEQAMRIHRPLAPEGEVVGRTRIVDIVDKGAGKGALIVAERVILDARSGKTVATLLETIFCRGDGGFGGKSISASQPHALPQRPHDLAIDLPTHAQLALIYRLSGDMNPLHSDPEIARAAGFERPILHGLATYGVAGHGLMALLCGCEPERFIALGGRFSAPAYPGETLRVEVWRNTPGTASFRVVVPARQAVVLNNGFFEYVE